jgi:DNA-binding transcriptional LysR family regulator
MEGWTGVELRHFAALSAIHEERSFRGAADRLGYVQSAVSQQIAQLEMLVGVRLVDRVRGHARPVHLTSAGMLLLKHASRVLVQVDAAEADLRALAAGGTPSMRIGADHAVATRMLPLTLRRLSRGEPAMTIQIEDAPSDRDHLAGVMSGELDAAIGELPLVGEGLVCAEVLVDPCVLLVPATSPLAEAGVTLGLADLVAQPLIAHTSWPMLELIGSHLRAAGHEPHYVTNAHTNSTVQALVGAGVGLAILPRLAVNEDDPRTVLVELGDLLPARRLALYWHEGRQHLPALTALHAAIVATAREIRRSYRVNSVPDAGVVPVPKRLPRPKGRVVLAG